MDSGEGNKEEDAVVCTHQKCQEDDGLNRLFCVECKRFVHYRCTRLPLYQLECFITKKSRKYTCVNCVDIRGDLLELMAGYDPDQSLEVEELTQALQEISFQNNKTKTVNKALHSQQKKTVQSYGRRNERNGKE